VRPVEELDTPAVLVDLGAVERNIMRMAARARQAGARLRPHAKTHKIPEIGRLQIAAGASGLSLAKVGEAEVFAAAGFEDLFLAYPVVGRQKAARLLALAERARLAIGADSEEGLRTIAGPFHSAGQSIDVLLKVDTGLHRVGVAPESARAMAERLAELPGARIRGVFTHAGHGYLAGSPEELAAVGRQEGEILAAVAAELRGAGLPVEEVSVGSTPTAPHAMRVPGVTECRPGNYVYHDASQLSLATCSEEDLALTVLATVVSVPDETRAVLDAGSKTLSSDPLRPRSGGHGFIRGRRSRIERLSEEHGVVRVEPGERFRVGEKVVVYPNHACVVSNLHDAVWAVRDGAVEGTLRVAARGRVQ
jgi:D-serine deaminase-like pyridoxal phosphate-dependent protein